MILFQTLYLPDGFLIGVPRISSRGAVSWTGTRVWFLLLALGLVATTLAAAPVPLRASTAMQGAAVILPVAWVKMRLILRHCLGLARAPTRGGIFERVLGAFRVLALRDLCHPVPAGLVPARPAARRADAPGARGSDLGDPSRT